MLKKLMLPVITVAIMLVMSATALAEGWAQDGTSWVYYDANNNKVCNEWRKGADDLWRYLGQNGVMVTDSFVDTYYYVDSEGKMTAECWKQITTTDGTYWYYFLDSGKMVMDGWKEIKSKKYFFNEEGKLQTGWVDDDRCYCHADGYMLTGWNKLPDSEDKSTDCPSGKDGASEHWYYLQSSGRKVEPSSDNFIEKTIDGKRFCFDENGAMMTGWVNITGDDDISGYKYFNTDGTVRTGWYSLTPPEDVADDYDNAVEWFYFSSTGAVTHAASSTYTTSDIKRISSKRYLFNKYGTPVYGLVKVYNDTDWDTYYFGTSNQCQAQKGQMSITEDDGTKSTFYFTESGVGYTGVKNNCLFYKGKIVKADTGTRYQTFNVNGNLYLVNQSGQVQRSKSKLKDADETLWYTNSAGIVTSGSGGLVETGDLPTIEFPD